MWNPDRTKLGQEFNKVVDKTQDEKTKIAKGNLKDVERANYDINGAIRRRDELLGNAVKRGFPIDGSTIDEAESTGRIERRREGVKDARVTRGNEDRREDRRERDDDPKYSRAREDKEIDSLKNKHHKMFEADAKLIKENFNDERKLNDEREPSREPKSESREREDRDVRRDDRREERKEDREKDREKRDERKDDRREENKEKREKDRDDRDAERDDKKEKRERKED